VRAVTAVGSDRVSSQFAAVTMIVSTTCPP